MSEASLDLDAVARLLRVMPYTARRWLRQGLLRPSAPGGRFARAHLEGWACLHDSRAQSRCSIASAAAAGPRWLSRESSTAAMPW